MGDMFPIFLNFLSSFKSSFLTTTFTITLTFLKHPRHLPSIASRCLPNLLVCSGPRPLPAEPQTNILGAGPLALRNNYLPILGFRVSGQASYVRSLGKNKDYQEFEICQARPG